MAKSKRSSKTTEDDIEVPIPVPPLIDPFGRLVALITFLVEAFLALFQNATIILFAVVLVVLELLFLFFSLLGLT